MLLKVKIPRAAANLAQGLDNEGLKPKGVWKDLEKTLRKREQASYIESITHDRDRLYAITGGKPSFDEQGHPGGAAVPFDDKTFFEALDGVQVGDDVPDSVSTDAKLEIFRSWRQHFSIPKSQLPPRVAALSGDKRRKWFASARTRIEATWSSLRADDEQFST